MDHESATHSQHIIIDCVWENQRRLKWKTLTTRGAGGVWGGAEGGSRTVAGRPAFESSRPALQALFERYGGPPPTVSDDAIDDDEDDDDDDDDDNRRRRQLRDAGLPASEARAWRWLSPWQVDNSDSFDVS